ncbi:MAG: bifunctional alpha,alpha-trehalose-phosphate synthase (UDP-forming)/trehalose-phosphatase [Bacteroidales bacterium]|nr:bifunctional alpha,alpha-trehalose-phosphate synthase (UDP-forming)/trehalose-phosphatase [Bacteroidales bacterium]
MNGKASKRLLIVSNRLPVKAEIHDEIIHLEKSAGGLATGLNSLDVSYEKHWIGWPGIYTSDNKTEKELDHSLESYNFHPVFLTEQEVELYYEGYSNSTLWPLFHYFYVYTMHNQDYWEAYKRVNAIFLEKVLEVATEDDIIWVQDYHLMLLPMMIREKLPRVRIGFFLHIPFPSYELFRTLENRDELMGGLLGADLIGFHTFDYMRHFVSTLYRIKGIETDDNTFHYQNRTLSVDTFPMGINFENFFNAHRQPEVRQFASHFRESYHDRKIILSVDRLDYSKGILRRLEAFRMLLHDYPEWTGKVSLVMILVPSRDSVDRYHDLRVSIDETVGNINGTLSQPGWIPIHYYYKGFSFNELTAFYHESDVALVTPLRDGMNLVAKEYVAAKSAKPGVLVLSEMAGAAIELTDALLVNPNNVGAIAETLNKALLMPANEQKARLARMQKKLKKYDVVKWAADFIEEMERIHLKQSHIIRKYLRPGQAREIAASFSKATKKLVILDYDGTLVPFNSDPALALPDESLKELLISLAGTSGVDMAIVSGRNSEFLQSIFGDLSITLFAEHGALRRVNGRWEDVYRKDLSWQPEIVRIMQEVTDSTPGSYLERKKTALVWHYRNTDKWLADLRAAQLVNKLIYPCTRRQLHLMRGEKIIEVKPSEYTKGSTIRNFYQFSNYDFILAGGDDTTDEDMFDVLPKEAVTVKVGKPSEKSKYTIRDNSEFIKLLRSLIK